MTRRFQAIPWVLILLLTGLWISQRRLQSLYPDPFPRFESLLVARHGLQDAALIVGGYRRLAADIAYVQYLEYLGGNLLPDEDPHRSYDLIKYFALRVARIDPYFTRIYTESAGILAWFRGVDRPGEAMDILREGIRYNPTYWPLRTYVAAIGYKQSGQFDNMVRMLEEVIHEPDCPILVKSILANAYKAHHLYREAGRIWLLVLMDPKEEDSHTRARHALEDLEALQKSKKR